MKKKNIKNAFNKKTSFALLLGIAASFSPLLVMGSCNVAIKKGDSSTKKIEPEVKNLAEELGKVTKTIKRKPVFSDYEFKNKEMTLSDFASNLGLNISKIAEYKNLKLIVNKNKGSSVVKIKIKGLSSEKDLELKISSFTTLEEYFKTLINQLKSSTISFENKTQFLAKEYSEEKMDQEALANNLKLSLPDNLLDKDVELKVTKNKDEVKVKYSLSIPGEKDETAIDVEIEHFFKDFPEVPWHKVTDENEVRDSHNNHNEEYFISQDSEGHYMLDLQYFRGFSGFPHKIKNSISFNQDDNKFMPENEDNEWLYDGNLVLSITDKLTYSFDGGWPIAHGYFQKYSDHSVSSYNREFESFLIHKKNYLLLKHGWYSSVIFIFHLDPTDNSIINSTWSYPGNIFLMPGYEDNKLFTKDRNDFPKENEPNEQDMYLTACRGMDIDADKLIFVSNSGMISATDYDLKVLPNIEVQNLLSNSEKERYYEVQRTNLNSILKGDYARISNYYSIDFISSTFKSLGDKGYTFMYWKNHNALSDEKDYSGFKDIYPDKKELYQVTLDKAFKIKENKKINLPAITLSYEDYKRKEKALHSHAFVGEKNNDFKLSDVNKTTKLFDDITNISASDVTNYFKTSVVEIGGKKYFYLADEKMTKILVLDNDYQIEKTIDIPMGAFKKLEEADGHQRYITKMFKKDNNLILFSNYLETIVIDTDGNIVKEPKANYSSDLAKYRNTIFQNSYKNTEIFQLDENKYLVFMHRINKGAELDWRITKTSTIVDADGQFTQE